MQGFYWYKKNVIISHLLFVRSIWGG